MIPKTIHACWFGDSELPTIYQKNIDSWKKNNPSYDIKIWSLNDFKPYLDETIPFVKYCLQNKIYGFLSDYFRLVVLYNFGGIYLDTDVECMKNLDKFLNSSFFLGYIFDCSLGTAVIGCEKGNSILLELLNKMLVSFENKRELTVSNEWMTDYFVNNIVGFKLNGCRQSLNSGIEVYPKEYFERLDLSREHIGGYTLHHCDGSWRKNSFSRKFIKPVIKLFLSKKQYEKLTLKRLTKKQKFYQLYKKEVD